MTGIKASADAYEEWLRKRLGDAFVAADLRKKHKDMAGNRFIFLRATAGAGRKSRRRSAPI